MLWAAGGLCLWTSFYVGVAPVVYNDFWLQAKVGELVAQQHAIPTTLLFPYTEVSAEAFNAHEWLASLLFHYAIACWGESGLPVFLGLLSAALYASVCLLVWLRNGHRLVPALACGLLAVWAENYRHWLRPELPALLLMVWLWLCVEQYLRHRHRWALARCFLLTIAWTNCHGSFILAPILVTLYVPAAIWKEVYQSRDARLVYRLLRMPVLHVGVVVGLATLVNPFGIQMHAFVLEFSTQTYVREHIPEWTSTLDARLSEPRGFYIGVTVWLLTLVRLLIDVLRKRWFVTEIMAFLAFSVLALYSIRFLVYLGVVAAFVYAAPRTVGTTVPRWPQSATLGLFSAMTLVLAMAYGNAYRTTPLIPPANVKFTPGLVQLLANPRLEGHVLNSLELGAELVYRAYPRLKPSLDSRIDSYGLDYILYQRALLEDDELLTEYVQRYDVRYILLDTVRYSVFAHRASVQRGEWRELYRSSKEVFLIRADLPDPMQQMPEN